MGINHDDFLERVDVGKAIAGLLSNSSIAKIVRTALLGRFTYPPFRRNKNKKGAVD
jgi:hypothetical protein